jgi:ABC-type multidrug transport system fused ATPase/permease subunit
MQKIVKQIWSMLGPAERRGLGKLTILLAIVTGLELLGLGVIMGAITVFTSKRHIPFLSQFLGIGEDAGNIQAFLVVGLFLVSFFIVKNLFILGVHYLLLRYLVKTELAFSRRLLRMYFNSRYDFIAMKNHAEILRNITSICTQCVNSVLRPLLFIVTDSTVAVCMVVFLLWFSPMATLGLLLLIGGAISAFFFIVKPRLSRYGLDLAETSAYRLQWINHAFGSIKERCIMNRDNYFVEGYQNVTQRYAKANAGYAFISKIPRSLIEIVLVTAILPIGVAVMVFEGGGQSNLIMTFGLFLGAAMRLIPAISAINANLQMLQLQAPNLAVMHNEIALLKQNAIKKALVREDIELLTFTNRIILDRISFRYQGTEAFVLDDVSLEVCKGESVAFVGSTGAGKTTIVDLIMGLIQPNKGRLLVDGREVRQNPHEWQKRIGYVPQSVYLLDGSIRQNVAFAIEDNAIDDKKVWQILGMVQLIEMVRELSEGLETRVGERGVRLSGGQRQRINIARALYHDPDILVLDEATAALDNVTEQEIVQAIDNLKHKKTLIIIAHRLSTVRNCDRIFFMKNGRIAAEGRYSELIKNNREFSRFAEGKVAEN